jgi:uncharacterized UBP type Zn finger protein
MEIGDQFKMKKTPFNKGCFYIDKIYTAQSFSKSKLSVYYEFKVSNKKCKCYQCSQRKIGINSIGLIDTELYQTKKEKDRLIKINRILKGVFN